MAQDITTAQFDEMVLKNMDKPVLVDFWATWCMPCTILSPRLDEIAEEFGEKILLTKVDVDKEYDLSEKYNIRGIPTVLMFYKGELKGEIVGVHDKEDYIDAINKILETK